MWQSFSLFFVAFATYIQLREQFFEDSMRREIIREGFSILSYSCKEAKCNQAKSHISLAQLNTLSTVYFLFRQRLHFICSCFLLHSPCILSSFSKTHYNAFFPGFRKLLSSTPVKVCDNITH